MDPLFNSVIRIISVLITAAIVVVIVVKLRGGFKPAWQSSNKQRALRAVAKMKDPAQLVMIATDYSYRLDKEVRLAAVERITEQHTLAEVAKCSSDKDVAFLASSKLNDEQLLVEVVLDSPIYGGAFPLAALDKVSAQASLEHIAVNHRYGTVRSAALERLNNQALLVSRMEEDADGATRFAAARRLLSLDPLFAPQIIHFIFEELASGRPTFNTGIEDHIADLAIFSCCIYYLRPKIPTDIVGGYTFDEDEHLEMLLSSNTPQAVINNLLHLTEWIADAKVTCHPVDCYGDTHTGTISFEALRTKAREKLGATPPQYCVDHYQELCKQTLKRQFQKQNSAL